MLPRIPETRTAHIGPGIPPLSAVRPAGPVDPALAGALGELARAGIDLTTLFEGGADTLVARALPTATALGDVLERARAAVVRGLPSEALAVLDDGWEGASRTEGGWYYRAAALMLLGLPGEADRVLTQALVPRGGSVALHFLHSVVRDFQGDSAGARESLANALARRPGHALLVSWQAVLLARTGDRVGAQALLAPLLDAEPESSVLAWARKAVTAAGAQHVRTSSMSLDIETDAPDDVLFRPLRAAPLLSDAPIDVALRKVGAQLVAGSAYDVRLEVRAMLQGLAPGGQLDGTVRPEHALSVRSALVAVLGALAREEPGAAPRPASPLEATADARGRWAFTPSSARPSVRADALPPSSGPRALLLQAMRAGDLATATSLLADVGAKEGEAVVSVLRTLLEGADAPVEQKAVTRLVQERHDDQLLVPIRVGLSLLQEASARDEARATIAATMPGVRDASSSAARVDSFATAPGDIRDAHDLPLAVALGTVVPPVIQTGLTDSAEADGALARDNIDENAHRRVATQIPSLAILCMALAFAALLAGYGIASIALAGGASWLMLRSSIAASRKRRQPIEQVTSEPERH